MEALCSQLQYLIAIFFYFTLAPFSFIILYLKPAGDSVFSVLEYILSSIIFLNKLVCAAEEAVVENQQMVAARIAHSSRS
jgi:hypothetical protein